MGSWVIIDKERCKGCGLCVRTCVRSVLKLAKGLNSKGVHHAECVNEENCNGCRHCVDVCPDCAIDVRKRQEAAAAGTTTAGGDG